MPIAHEIEAVAAGVLIWRAYDPTVKADLFSTAIGAGTRNYLIDPIDLAPQAMADLQNRGPIAGIIITNENHERAAGRFAEKLRVPIHVHANLLPATSLTAVQPMRDHDVLDQEITIVALEGGPAGEIAVHSSGASGTMVIGDALINVEPYGFAILPAKYCSNLKTLRRSLPTLLDYSFERMLFAHGMPILSGARQRLEELLRRR
ncbi:MAG TPA: hypothetical protein VGW57_15070 [Chthoniobacterales bacterium]|nr:hypothetical protein [Chthoniobacterales bacterium]